ncbi:hypothetical protein BDV11DRAFT_201112 [Aspergillus similis]
MQGGVVLIAFRGRDDVEEVLEVDAGQVSCPSGHAQPWVRIVQCVALGRPAGRLLLVVGRTGFDLGSDLLVISRRGSGLVGLGVARSDVHEVRVLACRKHLLPGNDAIRLLQLLPALSLLLNANSPTRGLLAPSMCLLPMLSHSLDMGTDVVALGRISLTLHAIGMKRDNGQRVLELLRDVDGISVLDQVGPLLYDRNNRLDL